MKINVVWRNVQTRMIGLEIERRNLHRFRSRLVLTLGERIKNFENQMATQDRPMESERYP